MKNKHVRTNFLLFVVSGLLLSSSLYGQNGNEELVAAIQAQKLAGVQHCIAANPGCVNTRDNNGRTPLHIAARFAPLPIVQFLVRSGADVNALDNLNKNPLHYAVDRLDNLEFLISQGADVNASCNSCGTLVNYLAFLTHSRSPEHILKMMRILMQAGADFSNNEEYAMPLVQLGQLRGREKIDAYQQTVKELIQYGVLLRDLTFNRLCHKYPALPNWIEEKTQLVRAWLGQSSGQQLPSDIERLLLSFIVSHVDRKRAREESEAIERLMKRFRA